MNQREAGPTERLSAFASGLSVEQIPPEVIHQAKRLLLDTLGCMIGGGTVAHGQLAVEWVRRNPGVSPVIGSSVSSTTMLSAYANGRLAAAIEADEIFPSSRQSSHLAVATVAASLAMVNERRGSGTDLLVALVAGYEVGARISNGMVPSPQASAGLRGGWGPGSPLAATAAASNAARLGASETAHAMGICGMHIDPPSLKWTEARPAPMTKSTDAGWHAMSAIAAVELAEIGTTGYDTILDGENGLWRALGYASADMDALTNGLVQRWLIMDSALKRWPCQYWMHPAITALWQIVREHHPSPRLIDKVVLRTNEKSFSAKFHDSEPPSEVDQAFSFPHVASMIISGVTPGPAWFEETHADGGLAHQLRHKVEVRLHPDAARWPEWVVDHQIRDLPAAAEVRVDGAVFRAEARLGLGSPWSSETRLTDEQLIGKFHELADPLRPEDPGWRDRLGDLVERVMNAERVPSVGAVLEPIARDRSAV